MILSAKELAYFCGTNSSKWFYGVTDSCGSSELENVVQTEISCNLKWQIQLSTAGVSGHPSKSMLIRIEPAIRREVWRCPDGSKLPSDWLVADVFFYGSLPLISSKCCIQHLHSQSDFMKGVRDALPITPYR